LTLGWTHTQIRGYHGDNVWTDGVVEGCPREEKGRKWKMRSDPVSIHTLAIGQTAGGLALSPRVQFNLFFFPSLSL
jgi:hypothetical protein